MAYQGIPLNKIQTLQLKDGTTIINNSKMNKIDLSNKKDRKFIVVEHKKLTTEQKFFELGVAVAVVNLNLYHNFSFAGDFYFGP